MDISDFRRLVNRFHLATVAHATLAVTDAGSSERMDRFGRMLDAKDALIVAFAEVNVAGEMAEFPLEDARDKVSDLKTDAGEYPREQRCEAMRAFLR